MVNTGEPNTEEPNKAILVPITIKTSKKNRGKKEAIHKPLLRHSRIPHRNIKIITHKEAKVHESGKNCPNGRVILTSCIRSNPL
jgi:hypothetical protein